jgi:mRNA interferase RelE/StbE
LTAPSEPVEDSTARAPEPYAVQLSRQARRNLSEDLPVDVAIAATETIRHSIAVNPSRAGKPLNEPFEGYYSARRGTYRIIYRIDEAKRVVEIHSIRHRRDVYRR